LLADTFNNNTDKVPYVVLAEWLARERRQHGLGVDSKQDERHRPLNPTRLILSVSPRDQTTGLATGQTLPLEPPVGTFNDPSFGVCIGKFVLCVS